jgi:methionyl-tRNA formyltransferase
MRIIFFGSGAVSLRYLEYLYGAEELTAVVTSPPKPAGRGLKPKETPVAAFAVEKGIPVKNNPSMSKPAPPELGVVVAYGKILPKAIIEYPKYGTINVHFSLLPEYRGAAPVQWALIKGEKKTGVTVFFLDEGMDTGKIILRKEEDIMPEDNAVTLGERLADIGVGLLCEALGLIKSGKAQVRPQEGKPSYAPVLKKEVGRINWDLDAAAIHNLISGVYPWPGAYGTLESGRRRTRVMLTASLASDDCPRAGGPDTEPGSVVCVEKGKGFIVKCGKGYLTVMRLKPEGKKEMPAWDFIQGARVSQGDVFVKHE